VVPELGNPEGHWVCVGLEGLSGWGFNRLPVSCYRFDVYRLTTWIQVDLVQGESRSHGTGELSRLRILLFLSGSRVCPPEAWIRPASSKPKATILMHGTLPAYPLSRRPVLFSRHKLPWYVSVGTGNC
jgi:hypothetical protein